MLEIFCGLRRYGMTEIGMALSNRVAGTRYPGLVPQQSRIQSGGRIPSNLNARCVGWPLPGVEVKQDQASTLRI